MQQSRIMWVPQTEIKKEGSHSLMAPHNKDGNDMNQKHQ